MGKYTNYYTHNDIDNTQCYSIVWCWLNIFSQLIRLRSRLSQFRHGVISKSACIFFNNKYFYVIHIQQLQPLEGNPCAFFGTLRTVEVYGIFMLIFLDDIKLGSGGSRSLDVLAKHSKSADLLYESSNAAEVWGFPQRKLYNQPSDGFPLIYFPAFMSHLWLIGHGCLCVS